MKLSDRWSVRGRRGDYVLTQTYPTKNPRTGEDTTGSKETYHPTLEQVANKIAKVHGQEALEKDTVDEVCAHLEDLAEDILGSLLEVRP